MNGQGWLQVGELALAFVLSATIGLERELRQNGSPRRSARRLRPGCRSSPCSAPPALHRPYGLTPLARRLSGRQPANAALSCTYIDGRGGLRELLRTCTASGWAVTRVETRPAAAVVGSGGEPGPPLVRVRLELHGEGSETRLIAALDDVDGVVEVGSEEIDDY